LNINKSEQEKAEAYKVRVLWWYVASWVRIWSKNSEIERTVRSW